MWISLLKKFLTVIAKVAASMAGKRRAFEELAERVKRRDPLGEKKIVVLLDEEKAPEDQLFLTFDRADLAERIDAIMLNIMHVMEYL